MNYEQWTGLREYTPNYPIRTLRKNALLQFLDQRVAAQQLGRVLDAGCFVGDVCKQIQDRGFEAHGIDAFPENIQLAQSKYPGIDFRVGELGQALPYPDSYFDVIWAGDVIEHVYDTIKLFSEFNRVMKAGATLIASTPMHNVPKMMLITVLGLHKHFHPEHKHVRFYTIRNFRMILKKYGFEVQSEQYFGRIKPIANNMLFISRKVRELDLAEVPQMFR
ncbi:MAG TPA: class I SAM-dependent methyltransferase [Polyangiaceae bacterium]|nr:class I SAM-dependent methyltransferase [Polyangiaceae bacterium]